MSSFNRLGEGILHPTGIRISKIRWIFIRAWRIITNFAVSDRDMTKFIIGTISNMDQPMTPAVKGDRSMNLYMNHVTKEMMEQERREVLHATQQDIRNLAGIVEQVLREDQVCVIGNEEKIEQDREVFTEIKALF